ncbi:MAG: acyl-CoA dehydrogenase family protein [Myxococcota bacterium]
METTQAAAGRATRHASEDEARALAEASRESWAGRSFLRELFLGTLHVDWIDPYPETPPSERFLAYAKQLEAFFRDEVDSAAIDADAQVPEAIVQRLRELGAFGMKIDQKYGGLGFDQSEYCKLLEICGAYDGSISALLSAHQSIGLPQPLKLFGTDEQKQKYLPRCAKGAISAFALTEPDVGSDPARLATTATRTENGDFVLDGEKLWITNGTVAELMIVMARHPDTDRISAFIVETSSPGVSVGHRCRFMGLRGIENGVIKFDGVRVPKENIVGGEGHGLKIALVTLNTGRLSLPAAVVGGAKRSLAWAREWSGERVQWGAAVGKHEAVSHMLAQLASHTWAMESWTRLACELSMREGYDIRLEAAAAKEWVSTRGWDGIDTVLQIRGGRGYETEASLAARGEQPWPVERFLRDSRINRIFEGSSEIMHLFMAREMVDKHLKVSGAMLEKNATMGDKLKALPGILAFYAGWYPGLWFGLGTFFRYGKYGKLAKHLRFAERASRRLARNVFHGMVRYQAKLERKQAFLFRTVDLAMEIAVMTASIVRAQKLVDAKAPEADAAVALAEAFALDARRYVDQRFRDLWANDDDAKTAAGRAMLDGAFTFLELDAEAPGDRARAAKALETAAK